MRINKTPAECCGCSACSVVCPVGAITMVPNAEGFLYPQINDAKCVDCGKCVTACSFKPDYVKAQKPVDAEYYAVVHKDQKIRRTSRSGGAFFSFAKAVLEKGGVVYGVALDESFTAKTVRIDRVEDLPRLQGSKYVQSDKTDSFVQVKADLEAGREVLFSGTGCEVAGLNSYLKLTRTDTAGLCTCDIVCHGVPSPLVWKDNLAYMEKKMGGAIDEVSFRDKCFGWGPHIESYRRGKKVMYSNRYTTVFYAHLTLRSSCGSCHFCNFERPADLTIADFWGVEKLELPITLSAGVSALMVHTEKGKELVDACREELEMFAVRQEDMIQPNLQRPSKLSPARESFWKKYQAEGFEKTTDSYYGFKNRLQLAYNYLLRRNKR